MQKKRMQTGMRFEKPFDIGNRQKGRGGFMPPRSAL